MKEEKWIPLFTEEEKAAILKHLDKQRKSEIHPDSSYGQWMKRFNTKLPQDTDGCSNDRSKCSCKDWGGCPVD